MEFFEALASVEVLYVGSVTCVSTFVFIKLNTNFSWTLSSSDVAKAKPNHNYYITLASATVEILNNC